MNSLSSCDDMTYTLLLMSIIFLLLLIFLSKYPADTPVCGWDGELCKTSYRVHVVITILVVFLATVTITKVLLKHKQRYEYNFLLVNLF